MTPRLFALKLSERGSPISRAPAFEIHNFQIDDDSDNSLASNDERDDSDDKTCRHSYRASESKSDEPKRRILARSPVVGLSVCLVSGDEYFDTEAGSESFSVIEHQYSFPSFAANGGLTGYP